jgi:hypothetical protein
MEVGKEIGTEAGYSGRMEAFGTEVVGKINMRLVGRSKGGCRKGGRGLVGRL